MAAPVIQNSTAVDNNNVFNKPTGLADNDVVYIMFPAFSGDVNNLPVNPTNLPVPPSGFTTVFMNFSAHASFAPFVACYRKIITSAAGEPSTYTVGAPPVHSTGWFYSGVIYRISGADTTTPEDDSGSSIDHADPISTGSVIDSSGNDALLLLCASAYSSMNTPPTGMTADGVGDAPANDAVVWSQTISSQLVSASRSISTTGNQVIDAIGFVVVKPPAGTQATPTAVASTWSIPAPVISTSVSATLTKVTGVFTIPTPAITAGTSIAVTVVAQTWTIPAPVVSASVSATLTAVAGVFTIPTPAVQTASFTNISATTVAATFTIPTPTLTVTSTPTPTVAAATFVIPTPSVTTGSTTSISATAVAASFTIPTPTLTMSASITVTRVQLVGVVGTSAPSNLTNISPTAVPMLMAAPTPAIATAVQIFATVVAAVFAIRTPTIPAGVSYVGGSATGAVTAQTGAGAVTGQTGAGAVTAQTATATVSSP